MGGFEKIRVYWRDLCKKYVAEDGKREMISQNYN